MFRGIVTGLPVLGSVTVTDGCPGLTGPVPGVIEIGAPGTFVGNVVVLPPGFGAAGAGCLSKIVVLTPPDCRVARIESDSEVTINKTADTVVAFDNNVAEPRGPNAVCEPIPPNAPARSAAFPLCNSTTTIRKRQITTCKIVNSVNSI